MCSRTRSRPPCQTVGRPPSTPQLARKGGTRQPTRSKFPPKFLLNFHQANFPPNFPMPPSPSNFLKPLAIWAWSLVRNLRTCTVQSGRSCTACPSTGGACPLKALASTSCVCHPLRSSTCARTAPRGKSLMANSRGAPCSAPICSGSGATSTSSSTRAGRRTQRHASASARGRQLPSPATPWRCAYCTGSSSWSAPSSYGSSSPPNSDDMRLMRRHAFAKLFNFFAVAI
mmetsp:Transcript_21619/g.50396  ORF Transcript_21619/g.50396 Transcript_21619/m.50396 type:complete len:229 (-) Transcript_21619:47-733(-)